MRVCGGGLAGLSGDHRPVPASRFMVCVSMLARRLEEEEEEVGEEQSIIHAADLDL